MAEHGLSWIGLTVHKCNGKAHGSIDLAAKKIFNTVKECQKDFEDILSKHEDYRQDKTEMKVTFRPPVGGDIAQFVSLFTQNRVEPNTNSEKKDIEQCDNREEVKECTGQPEKRTRQMTEKMTTARNSGETPSGADTEGDKGIDYPDGLGISCFLTKCLAKWLRRHSYKYYWEIYTPAGCAVPHHLRRLCSAKAQGTYSPSETVLQFSQFYKQNIQGTAREKTPMTVYFYIDI